MKRLSTIVWALSGFMSALAVILGAIGVYGVISHFASRRRRDWAIQIALGRSAPQIIRHIMGQGIGLAFGGLLVGLVGIIALGRMLASFLYKTAAVDPLSFLFASAVVLVIGALAALIPAWRVGAIDPARTLREQ